AGAPGQLLGRSHRARAGSVDVQVRRIVRIGDERVRVRAAAGLDGGDLLRLVHIADIEDADATEALGADRRRDTLGPAVQPPARLLDRYEQQVAVHGDVALPARTHHRGEQFRPVRTLDVIRIEAVIVADHHVV